MPELPEVTYSKNYADATILHKEITALTFSASKIFQAPEKDFKDALVHQEFTGTTRHGKYLFLETSGGKCLVLHFGMTGDLEYSHQGDAPEYAYFTITFSDNSRLFFICPRKFAKVFLADSIDQFKEEHSLGPDALDMPLEEFQKMLDGKRGSIKGALMNQKYIAGLGNLYSDEVLFQSGIHPTTKPVDLSEKEVKTIYKNISVVLDTVIKSKIYDTSLPSGYLTAHRKEGADCPKGKGKVKMMKVAGRSSYFCEEAP